MDEVKKKKLKKEQKNKLGQSVLTCKTWVIRLG